MPIQTTSIMEENNPNERDGNKRPKHFAAMTADDDIFALGDAASQLGDLDDLFSGIGVNLNELIGQGNVTQQTVNLNGPNANVVDDTMQIFNISKTDPTGKTTKARVIRGPVKCTKRIVKISRETPEGPEVIAELEAPPDGDVNELVKDYISGNKRNTGVYDNYDADKEEPSDTALTTQVLSVNKDEHGQEYIEPENENIPSQKKHSPFHQPAKRYPEQEPLLEDQEGQQSGGGSIKYKPSPRHLPNNLNNDTRRTSVMPSDDGNHQRSNSIIAWGDRRDSLPPPSPRKKHGSFDDDAIKVYKPGMIQEQDQSEVTHGYECDLCCVTIDCRPCLPCLAPARPTNTRRKKRNKKNKGGMTCSEILQDKNSLPGVKSLVANYAKMLFHDREQFVETMFRAVKLNQLDVLKILCKIVHKSGMKVSDTSLREPESSATILHVALLYNHAHMVDFLLESRDPDLLLARYETAEYRNQTGLHVAVANGDAEVVEKLLLALVPGERQVYI